MRLEIKDTETFVPEWNGNMELAADEQIVFNYKSPTLPERKKLVQKANIKFNYDRDGNPIGGTGEVDMDDEAPIRAVRNLVISNLEYQRGGKVKIIRSGEDLLSAPAQFHGLVAEFAAYLRDKAKEDVPEKN